MKKLLIPLLLLFGSSVQAQLLKPVGNPLPVENNLLFTDVSVYGLVSDGSSLSILFLRSVDTTRVTGQDTIQFTNTYQISEWNNNQWDSVSSLIIRTGYYLFTPVHGSFRKHRGIYYFAINGYQGQHPTDTIFGLPKTYYNLLSYSHSTGWNALSPTMYNNEKIEPYKVSGLDGFNNLEFKGDTIYCLENVRPDGIGSYISRTCLFRHYDGIWDTIPIPHYKDSLNGATHKLYHDGTDLLYINSGVYGIHKIKGTSLQQISIPRIADKVQTGSATFLKMNHRYFGKFGNEVLTLNDSNAISYWNGTAFQYTFNSKHLYLRSFVRFKGKFYALGAGTINTNGNNNVYQKILRLEGQNWVEISAPFAEADRVYYLVEHHGRLYVAGKFDRQGTETVARLADQLILVSGFVYNDSNSNCQRESTEKIFKNAIIRFDPGKTLVNTDESGRYRVILDSGSYRISLISKKYYAPACYALGDSFKMAHNDILNADIAQSQVSAADLSVSLNGGNGQAARRGAQVHYQILVSNPGTYSTYAKLTLQFDKRLKNFSSSHSYTKMNDSTYLFSIDTIKPEGERTYNFSLYTDPANLILGDKIKLHVFVKPPADVDTSDNYDTLNQIIITAYDPNHKDCYPSGRITHDLKKIKYHIQFQNLGKDTAIRVRVTDTFDARLPLHKVVISGYSHPYKVSLLNNVITWTFDNIMLTPDRVNYDKSHGFISFTAFIDGTMAVGDSIRNMASIYFDYEDAVLTNFATIARVQDSSTINLPPAKPWGDKSIRVYPNPSSGHINIEFSEFGTHLLKCYDLLGREVRTLQFTGEGVKSFDLTGLAAGLYTIRDTHGNTSMIILHQ